MRELPHKIRRSMSEDSFKKAVIENFEAMFTLLQRMAQKSADDDKARPTIEDMEDKAEDSAGSVTDRLNEAGVGNPDGNAPQVAPTNVALTSGINYDIWVTWSNIANNSSVAYVVERATASTGPWTVVGETVSLPGDASGTFQYHDSGLLLNTNYYYRVKGKDGDGDGPYSTVAGPQQVNKTVNEQIADATIDLGTKIQGLLPNANLATISDPAKLAAAVVTAGKLAIGSINSSNLLVSDVIASNHLLAGSVVAGKIATDAIVAGNIQAGQIQTGHIAVNSLNGDRISAGTITGGKIIAGSITAQEIAANAVTADKIDANAITGKIIRTAAGPADRIVMKEDTSFAGAIADLTIAFRSNSNVKNGTISVIGPDMYVEANGTLKLRGGTGEGININSTSVSISKDVFIIGAGTDLSVDGAITAGQALQGSKLFVGTVSTIPPAGFANLYKGTGNTLDVRFPDGTIKSVNLT